MSRFFGWLPHSAAARIGRQGLTRSVLSRPDSPECSGAVWNRRPPSMRPSGGWERIAVGQAPPPDEKGPPRDHSFLLALLRNLAAQPG